MFFVLFGYFCLFASYPPQLEEKIWRQTQKFIVLALCLNLIFFFQIGRQCELLPDHIQFSIISDDQCFHYFERNPYFKKRKVQVIGEQKLALMWRIACYSAKTKQPYYLSQCSWLAFKFSTVILWYFRALLVSWIYLLIYM